MSNEYIEHLKQEFLLKGCVYIDLLKLIWFPIMLSDSSQLLYDASILLMAYFNIGYPQVSKANMKKVFKNVSSLLPSTQSIYKHTRSRLSSAVTLLSRRRMSNASSYSINELISYSDLTARSTNTFAAKQTETEKVTFNCILVPHYMPRIINIENLEDFRNILKSACQDIFNKSLETIPRSERPELLLIPSVCLKYSFPWGLVPGFFERFSVNCIINSDLYYKMHWKDAIYAYNEENTIGALIYVTNKETDSQNITEIVFEFYLIDIKQQQRSQIDLEDESMNKLNEINQITIDFEVLWTLIMQVVVLFEDMLLTFPSMLYDRHSQCPSCRSFTFLGEWMTPKELKFSTLLPRLQNLRTKKCVNCEKEIESVYLVKPSSGKHLAMELKRMKERLESLVNLRTESATVVENNSPRAPSRLNSPLKSASPTMKGISNKTITLQKSTKFILNN